jgi:hypothetical protein
MACQIALIAMQPRGNGMEVGTMIAAQRHR